MNQNAPASSASIERSGLPKPVTTMHTASGSSARTRRTNAMPSMPGHAQIRDDEIEGPLLESLERRARIALGDDREAFAFEITHERRAKQRVVVHDQNRPTARRRAAIHISPRRCAV